MNCRGEGTSPFSIDFVCDFCVDGGSGALGVNVFLLYCVKGIWLCEAAVICQMGNQQLRPLFFC
jgi:hypothetical protein